MPDPSAPGPAAMQHLKMSLRLSDEPSRPLASPSRSSGTTSMGGAWVPIWSVPYRRNPFFTGQEAILTRLRTALTVNKTAALTQQATPQAISGLGGIGKTQIALEYA